MAAIPLITILGPTAVGKTTLAAQLAYLLDAEIISADSRQVFQGMDIGTGKDLSEYVVKGKAIPYHVIDTVEAGSEYSVYQFQRDFSQAASSVYSRGRIPLLCGGTGMYLDAVLFGYQLLKAEEDSTLRQELERKSMAELIDMLSNMRPLHNKTDVEDKTRLIRAIEIELNKQVKRTATHFQTYYNSPVLGLRFDRKIMRDRITQRLKQRFEEGMVEEVRNLINSGVSTERLKMYGLEYKYISLYLDGELSYDNMFLLLNTAIHQFAKRQMTWFRRMENKGIKIVWLEGENGLEHNLEAAINFIKSWKPEKNSPG